MALKCKPPKILWVVLIFLLGSKSTFALPNPIEANNQNQDLDHYQFTHLTQSVYEHLSQSQQTTLASMWGLTPQSYNAYFRLMEETPNGWYYRDQHLDPNWILGLNATNEAQQRQYIIQAIKNERVRIAKLLAFQRAFDRLQREMFPTEKPITVTKPSVTPVTCR